MNAGFNGNTIYRHGWNTWISLRWFVLFPNGKFTRTGESRVFFCLGVLKHIQEEGWRMGDHEWLYDILDRPERPQRGESSPKWPHIEGIGYALRAENTFHEKRSAQDERATFFFGIRLPELPSVKHTKNDGKSPFSMRKSTISMDHVQELDVCLPEGKIIQSQHIPTRYSPLYGPITHRHGIYPQHIHCICPWHSKEFCKLQTKLQHLEFHDNIHAYVMGAWMY